ncbi:hypothetical protein BN14_02798 [Rhizoctonia solani AG-1 IB]|uniref:Uncharacterized protein n=1 Tax=Thanatephorus cucumeris (strain AG1-IB / isolate 7/3/14) TaxID=1108050 RepID=M5BQQ9_THACB|nr:hypothetical protein BN14_02798 [Rhizoctonia solani AG-1 IB]
MSSQRRDFRRMLYRLDLATSYPSIPALIQHFMDETALDGVVEVKMVASPPRPTPVPTKGKRSNKPPPPPPPPLQPVTSVISFRREGRDVNAIALFGPASAPSSMFPAEEQGGLPRNLDNPLAFLDMPGMVVKKRYPPRTTLVWVFAPLVQKLLDEGADTVMFEVRSYIAGADSVREAQSTLSPVSPYGTAHSTTEASPSVLASGSTPSSGQGSTFEDLSAIQYAQSPVTYPHVDNKAPILTELHRRPQEIRAEVMYESPRPLHYSPAQREPSIPTHVPGPGVPHWSLPQPEAWNTATGYSDLQPLPVAPSWNSSFSSEGWNEHPGSTWQSDSTSASYDYPTIPPLPWQALQEPSYTPGALEPTAGQTYFGGAAASPDFQEGYYIPHADLNDQPSFSTNIHEAMTARSGETPITYESPGVGFQGDNRVANWQAQYPYLGALSVPPSEAFPYSPTSHDRSGEMRTSEFDQRPGSGSPTSPPDSSERDSLTPTLTNPGFERAPAPAPQKQWPFARGPSNQPAHWHRSISAYTPVSSGPGVPGPSRSVSAVLPRSRIRLRSSSPEPAREASIRGAKRLKVNPDIFSSTHLQPADVASPPPISAGSSSSAPRSLKSRVSSTIRPGSSTHRSYQTASPNDGAQDQQEADVSLLEILSRPAPYKRMLGYAARQHDGSIVAYELADSVAATTFSDTLLGLGLSSVTNVAALGMELGRRAAHRQQNSNLRGAVQHDQTATTHTYGEHGIPQQPQGGDSRTGRFRGAISRPAWQGCVIA